MLSDTIASSTSALCLLYLLISCNFLAELFGCRLQALLRNSMIAKHLVGFLTLLFFAVLVDPSMGKWSASQMMLSAVCLYAWFILTTRTHISFMPVIFGLLLVVYVLNIYKTKTEDNEENRNKIKKLTLAQTVLSGIAIAITLIGVAIYFRLKQIEKKSAFRVFDFVLGNAACANSTPSEAELSLASLKKLVGGV